MKRVLFVINTMGQAGAERAMLELMRAMPDADFKLYLLVLLNRGELFLEVPKKVHILNKNPNSGSILAGGNKVLARLVAKKLFYNGSVFRNFFGIYVNYIRQKRAGRVQPDKLLWRLVSDGTERLPAFDAAVAFLEGGAAYYVADHVKAEKKAAFVHIEYKKSGFTPELDHGCYDKMDRIYAVSDGVRQSFLSMYPQYREKISIFHNIINTAMIRQRALDGKSFSDGFEGIRILTVGRLHYQKGYDITIPAVMRLKEMGFAVRWYVLGDGSGRRDVERWIRDAGAENDFILLGAVSNPYPYIRACDLYVHVTRYEGKSIAIEEAQVLGKAIIASDCPGNREQIVNGKNGILVRLSTQETVEAIASLLLDGELRRRYEQASADMDFEEKEQVSDFCGWLQS